MNLEKFTERSRGFLQAAQTIAMRESHQRLAPEHLLKAIMDDDQGLAANLIRRAGGEPARVTEAVNLAVSRQTKVSGDAQPFMDPGLAKVLDEAEKVAKKAGDSFVPVERILMALAMVSSKAKDALDAGAVILIGTSISFLGAGASPPTAEWGLMVAGGRHYLPGAWWPSLFPGLAIFVTVMSLNLIGDGLRDLFAGD